LAGSVFAAPAPGVATPSGGVTRITITETEKANLVLSDELVAWQESSHIFIYTPAGGVQDLSGAIGGLNQLDQSPQVSGDRVVWWAQTTRHDIYTWAISDPVIRRVSTDDLLYTQDPQISGDRITFRAVLGTGDYQVFTWTLEGGVEQVSTAANWGLVSPRVSGDDVAYVVRTGTSPQEYLLYSWVAGGAGPVQIASDVVWNDLDLTDMADGRVVGLGQPANSTSYEVITWAPGDTTLTRVGGFTAQDHAPRVSGGRIVWENAAGGVDTWSVTDPVVSSVTDDAVFGVSPDISGNRVVWAKSLSWQSDPNDPMYPFGHESEIIGAGPVLWTPGASTFYDIPYTGQLAGGVLVSPNRVAFLGWEGVPFEGGVQQVYLLDTPPCTLTYTAGVGGTISGTSPQTVDYGTSGALVTAAPADGYHFVSWSDDVATAARTDAGVTGDITVSATFAIDTYTLTYTAGVGGTISGTSPQTVNYGTSGALVTATPADGYHFVSWSDDVATAARTDAGVTGDHDVTATFAINSNTITFNSDGGSDVTAITADFGTAVTAPTAPTKTGNTFVGWYGDSQLNTPYTFSTMPASSITLYAKWTVTPVLMPVWRFYNMRTGTHFYTASVAEKNNVVAALSSIYRLEGVAYYVNTANPANNTPLYRFYNVKTGVHFYTASETEKDNVLRTLSSTYRLEGVAYYVCATPVAGATSVYRFLNFKKGVHFYTASAAERDTVVRTLWSTYRLEGVGFYLAP
jgi:uncharacterized repeat protein (TIGR02543 family)